MSKTYAMVSMSRYGGKGKGVDKNGEVKRVSGRSPMLAWLYLGHTCISASDAVSLSSQIVQSKQIDIDGAPQWQRTDIGAQRRSTLRCHCPNERTSGPRS